MAILAGSHGFTIGLAILALFSAMVACASAVVLDTPYLPLVLSFDKKCGCNVTTTCTPVVLTSSIATATDSGYQGIEPTKTIVDSMTTYTTYDCGGTTTMFPTTSLSTTNLTPSLTTQTDPGQPGQSAPPSTYGSLSSASTTSSTLDVHNSSSSTVAPSTGSLPSSSIPEPSSTSSSAPATSASITESDSNSLVPSSTGSSSQSQSTSGPSSSSVSETSPTISFSTVPTSFSTWSSSSVDSASLIPTSPSTPPQTSTDTSTSLSTPSTIESLPGTSGGGGSSSLSAGNSISQTSSGSTSIPPGTTTSLSVTATPSATSSANPTNATVPFWIPKFSVAIDNGTYYLPHCDDEPQTLFRSDGTMFTLFCDHIDSSTGILVLPPDPKTEGSCEPDDVCFYKRNLTSSCGSSSPPGRLRIQSWDKTSPRQASNTTRDALKNIANTLADLLPGGSSGSSGGSGGAAQGLAEFSCLAEGMYAKLAWSFFDMGLKPQNIITLGLDIITGIFNAFFSLSDPLVSNIHAWIDTVDTTFSELGVCLDCANNFEQSAICRALARHGDIHRSMNTVVSVKNVAHQNVILKIIEAILNSTLSYYRNNVFDFIGHWGSLINGWQQAHRLCRTQWGFDHLDQPGQEEKEDDDEDDWYPRYDMQLKPGTTYADLQSLKPLLDKATGFDVGADAQHVPDMGAAYVMEVHPRQVDLVQMHPAVDFIRCMGIPSGAVKDHEDTETQRTYMDDVDGTWSPPAANIKQDEPPQAEPTSDYFQLHALDYQKILSMRKGFDISKEDNFYFHSPRGEGAWIFMMDSGFSTDNWPIEYSETLSNPPGTRRVERFMVKQEKCIFKLGPPAVEFGWTYAIQSVDDIDCTHIPGGGHGTPVGIVAGGRTRGVASRANLHGVKFLSGYNDPRRTRTANVWNPGVTRPALIDAFKHIWDLMILQPSKYPPTKSVICLTARFFTTGDAWTAFATEDQWFAVWNEWTTRLDRLGVTIVIASGNDGVEQGKTTPARYLADSLPMKWATKDSPFILVGGTFSDGSLWEGTTPDSPQAGIESTIYAQAQNIPTCMMDGRILPDNGGTSFAAPAVAGLIANLLTYPWQDPNNNPLDPYNGGGSMGDRVKAAITDWSYQRLPDNEIANRAMSRLGWATWSATYPIPTRVNVAYNMAHGPQRCLQVPNFPAGKFEAGTCPLLADSSPNESPTYTSAVFTDYITTLSSTSYISDETSTSTTPGSTTSASTTSGADTSVTQPTWTLTISHSASPTSSTPTLTTASGASSSTVVPSCSPTPTGTLGPVHEVNVAEYAVLFCREHFNKAMLFIEHGKPIVGSAVAIEGVGYCYSVEWTSDGCPNEATAQLLPSEKDCNLIYQNNWQSCNNGSWGGATQIGCLRFQFYPTMPDEVGSWMDVCVLPLRPGSSQMNFGARQTGQDDDR